MSSTATPVAAPTDWDTPDMQRRIGRRYRNDRLFRGFGLAALALAGLFLLFLISAIAVRGLPGFIQTEIRLTVDLDPRIIGEVTGETEEARRSNLLRAPWSSLVLRALQRQFPEVPEGAQLRALLQVVSRSGAEEALLDTVAEDPDLVGQSVEIWVPAEDRIDQYVKGNIDPDLPAAERPISDRAIGWVETLREDGRIRTGWNDYLFAHGASRYPEQAGIWGAVVGSFLTLIVTLLVAFPVGVCAAVYLEECAPHNRFTDIIEVNINNLAAVPSIVFGLLGLAVFLNTFELPRSAPLVGGLTLALMTLPTIIIATRAAIKAVPPSIRDAARGLGASPVQVVFHHVVPMALPGILTGTIIGMAQALGETAPLLMIGMVAFIVDIPGGLTDPATVLPVQIFIWSDFPERGFVEKTASAIIVLLMFLMLMNALAIVLRQRFERRW